MPPHPRYHATPLTRNARASLPVQVAHDGLRTFADPRASFESYAAEFAAAQERGVDLLDLTTWAPQAHTHTAFDAPRR